MNLRRALALLNPLGEDTQPKRLGASNSVVARCTIRHRARNLRDLGDPPPIRLLLDFDREFHTIRMPQTAGKHKCDGFSI